MHFDELSPYTWVYDENHNIQIIRMIDNDFEKTLKYLDKNNFIFFLATEKDFFSLTDDYSYLPKAPWYVINNIIKCFDIKVMTELLKKYKDTFV